MSDHSSRDMKGLRSEIDRVDTAILDLIAERMTLAKAVRDAKSGIHVWRPAREEAHVRELAAKSGGTSPQLVARIWAELMSVSLTIQGPICLHVARTGPLADDMNLVRGRFGAAIPLKAYPTSSAAIAAAQSDPEGVAVLPAPGGMDHWWTALGPGGAAANMNILAAIPRIGNHDWPLAVAVSKAARSPSGDDDTLLCVSGAPEQAKAALARNSISAAERATSGDWTLFSLAGYFAKDDRRLTDLFVGKKTKIIGTMPKVTAG